MMSRQVYSDYAFCQAAKYKTSDGTHSLSILLIYDIACQWCIKFAQRLAQNNGLTFHQIGDVKFAVGKFHLGTHQKSCFRSYNLNFMTGVGHVDGEILETLWSKFNDFGLMTRAMSNGHRWDTLNDHMRDVNFKKMLRMSK